MEREHEGHRLARLHVARVVEEIGAARLHLDDVAFVDDAIGWAVGVGTVQSRRRDAGRAGEPERILRPHRGRARENRDEHKRCLMQQAICFHVYSISRRSRADASGSLREGAAISSPG